MLSTFPRCQCYCTWYRANVTLRLFLPSLPLPYDASVTVPGIGIWKCHFRWFIFTASAAATRDGVTTTIGSLSQQTTIMPRPSFRQEQLDRVAQARQSARQLRLILDESSCSDSSDSSDSSGSTSSASIIELLDQWDQRLQAIAEQIRVTRVLQPRPPVPRLPQIQLLDHHRVHHPHLFRKAVRVDPCTFDKLVELIQDHAVFSRSQPRPAIQLAIFLHRAGHYGNRSGLDDVADWAGVSTGAVVNCTNRVMVAILHLHDSVIGPPSDDDSERAKAYVASVTCPEWAGGKLTGDGTLFPLFERPGFHGDTWLDRKFRYSINAQVFPHF